jgi:DNA-directed RNA polymerase subunit RPC12/RpoP
VANYIAKCSHCGMGIIIDNKKPLCVCKNCGIKVLSRVAGKMIDSYEYSESDILLHSAYEKFKIGNYASATQDYEKLLEKDSNNWEALAYKEISSFMSLPLLTTEFLNFGKFRYLKQENIFCHKNKTIDEYFEFIKEKASNDLLCLLEKQENLWNLSEYTKFELEAREKYLKNFIFCVEGYKLSLLFTEDNNKRIHIYKKLEFLLTTLNNQPLSENYKSKVTEDLSTYNSLLNQALKY